jgi:hypothetical protein
MVLLILETFYAANVFTVPVEVLLNFTESFSVTPPLRIRYVSMLLVSIRCLFRHTGILNLGKQKMGAWTSAFTIGISNREVPALSTVKGYIPINLNIETNYLQFF